MKTENLYELCKAEEAIAHIHGWDFSHIAGRYEEEASLPWDYRAEILSRLTPAMGILDIDTGGGEFLLSLDHPFANTAAMENFPPNVTLCEETLLPLGIDFRPGDGGGPYPFEDGRFDLVINRHGAFSPEEIFRVLKPGGYFITQQVGAKNDRGLVKLLCGHNSIIFSEQYPSITADKFRAAGFEILRAQEAFPPIRFYDVGALTWFARILPWEFPNFSVDTHWEQLLEAQQILENHGVIEDRVHRFLLIAQKR